MIAKDVKSFKRLPEKWELRAMSKQEKDDYFASRKARANQKPCLVCGKVGCDGTK